MQCSKSQDSNVDNEKNKGTIELEFNVCIYPQIGMHSSGHFKTNILFILYMFRGNQTIKLKLRGTSNYDKRKSIDLLCQLHVN